MTTLVWKEDHRCMAWSDPRLAYRADTAVGGEYYINPIYSLMASPGRFLYYQVDYFPLLAGLGGGPPHAELGRVQTAAQGKALAQRHHDSTAGS